MLQIEQRFRTPLKITNLQKYSCFYLESLQHDPGNITLSIASPIQLGSMCIGSTPSRSLVLPDPSHLNRSQLLSRRLLALRGCPCHLLYSASPSHIKPDSPSYILILPAVDVPLRHQPPSQAPRGAPLPVRTPNSLLKMTNLLGVTPLAARRLTLP